MADLAFHRKYRPNTLKDYIGNDKLKTSMLSALKRDKRPQVILLSGDSGCGKAQPLDSLVLTTSGYKRMGDIIVGDEVFTHSGEKGFISGIYPQGVRPIYRITLSDRTYIDVSDEHLNSVYLFNTKTKMREDYVLTTLDLIDKFKTSKYKLRVEVPSVDFGYKEVPMNPYLLGALIGDGNLTSYVFSNFEYDIILKVHNLLYNEFGMVLADSSGYDYKIRSADTSTYVFSYKDETYFGCNKMASALEAEGYPSFDAETLKNLASNNAPIILDRYPELYNAIELYETNGTVSAKKFRDAIRTLGIECTSKEKRIPQEYLYNSKEVRLQVLQGLFDTDGFISKKGGVEFTTSSKGLSDDFAFLVRSLGIRDTITEKPSGYVDGDDNYHSCSTCYRHFLKCPNNIEFCTSLKHLSRKTVRQHEPIRNIVSIEYIGDKECQCIMVDHKDHTYISDYFIPTHNTTFARLLAKEYLCENRDNDSGACNGCYSCQQLDDYIQTGDTSMLENVREVDIADQSGKKDIDTVLEDMLIPSFGGQWRVFIFDEVHMATNQAQNRMLKIAEEPPEYVLMIFCTTDPDMLLETLRNRCQLTLKVRKPAVSELGGLLKKVCTTEGVDCDTKGVNFIANRSGLTIRKALTSLEQVVNECGDAKYESAIGVFEELADTVIVDFLEKLIGKPVYDSSGNIKKDELGNPVMKRDVLGYITTLNKIKSQSSLPSFVQYLSEFVQRGIYVINQVQLDGIADGELAVYRNLFGDFSIEMLTGLVSSLVALFDAGVDLELRLIQLGYTGIPMGTYNKVVQESGIVDTDLAFMMDEISKEIKSGDDERAKNKQELDLQGVSNATNLTRASSLSDVEALFGGTEVPL